MIDPRLIREEVTKVREGIQSRGYSIEMLEVYVKKDEEWRQLLTQLDSLKHQRKSLTPKQKPTPEQLHVLKRLSDEIEQLETKVQEHETVTRQSALELPNVPDATVPRGASAEENQEVRQIGIPTHFSFSPQSHEEVGVRLGMLDFERAVKVTGTRFSFFTGIGARLERALIQFMLDLHTIEHGYHEISPPALVNSQSMMGTGQLPKFSEESFQVSDSDLWLSPTAEVQLTNMYRDTILNEEQLPLRLTAYTPCFRKEAGSYGKDVKGIIRQHQFDKVELVKFATPDQSFSELEGLVQNAEEVLKRLELPYRVVMLCTGDLGFSSAKTYDLEVWFPSQNRYREILSCSNFLDFQSRRAMIRFKQKFSGKVQYLHTLNGSGVAIGRTFAAILENYQNEDGTVRVPKVLQPYLGRSVIKRETELKTGD